eukprot:Em0014g542a
MSAGSSDLRGRYRYNLFCRLFFLWVEPLLWTGCKRKLVQSDLDVKVEELDSTKLLNTFNWYWNKELERKKRGKPARLGLAIVMCVWWRLIVQGALSFCEIGVNVLQSVVTGLLSQYFAQQYHSSTDTRNAYIYAACLVATALVVLLLHSFSYFIGQKIGTIVRATLTAAIHQKIMKLNQATAGQVSTGHVVNLASSDAQKFDQAFVFIHLLWISPLLLVASTYLLYTKCSVGLASLIPIEVIIIALPIQVFLFRTFSSEKFKSAIWTDKRIKIMNEIISGMRVIKMYGWEDAFRRVVNQLRSKESLCVLKAGLLNGSNLAIEYMTAPVMMFGIFSIHMATGGTLTTRSIFTALSLLTVIQKYVMRLYVKGIFSVIEVNVATSRIREFLELVEGNSANGMQTEHEANESEKKLDDKINNDKQSPETAKYIETKNLYASWSLKDDENMTLQNISLDVNKDAPFLAVVGPVGSGKSTLLQCLLGELHPVQGTVEVKGKVAYVSQDPWLFTGTLRDNILFGCPFYVDWYDAVLDACALHQDIEQLPNGDLTIVGERGGTLSGGQKARVSLARAIYVDYDVYLLDDPLSAVDAVVAKHIFERCICGLLKDRLVVLVTHQLQFAEQANNILALNDGKMVAYGNIQHLRANRVTSEKLLEIKKDDQSNDKKETDEETCAHNKTKKTTLNIYKERSHGTTTIQTYIQYFKMGASPLSLLLAIGVLVIGEVSRVISDWWIADWANCFKRGNYINSTSNNHDSCILTTAQRLEIYGGIMLINVILNLGRAASVYFILVKASHALHNKTLASILGFPIRFFDTNPIGKILNYFSEDVSTLDDQLPIQMAELLMMALRCLAVILTIAVANTSREIKRLEAIARGPIYSHLSESLLGLSTIRTFGREKAAQEYFHEYVNQHTKLCYLFIATTRWFVMRNDTLATSSPWYTGIFIYSSSFKSESWTRWSCFDIYSFFKKPDPGWPQGGMIVFDNASFRYSADTPVALKPLTFIVQPGEKIGIIGRTGAGKSSLIQMLFRMAEHTGNISIDGVNIRDVELHELRKSISIIPQDPVLFSGSLRYNLDPFEEYNDSDVQLKSAVEKWDGGIELKVVEGGRNFSIGQRQLVCLARAILRKNKILVLDEATANVDFTTDAMIQKILQETFAQCTVLTVAHRLNTVIGLDRIMVMDGGEIVELDDPFELLKNKNSLLNKMVDRTGSSNSAQLYLIAEAAHLSRKKRIL